MNDAEPPDPRHSDLHAEVPYNMECKRGCGLLQAVAFKDIGREIATHYAKVHPGQSEIRYDVDYIVYPAPERCDFCFTVVEPPTWTHVATPPIELVGGVVDDGRWLLCHVCHDLIMARDLEACVQRWWGQQTEQTPMLIGDPQKPNMLRMVRAQLRHMFTSFDAGTRNTVG